MMDKYNVKDIQTNLADWAGNEEMYFASEVDAERAIDKEVIKQLNGIINTGIGNQLNDYYEIDKLKKEIARLRKALEFYANKETWENKTRFYSKGILEYRDIDIDSGKVARKALARIAELEGK
jgi:hypothetical protein